ncbi:MAG: hypothetical protein IKT14_02885 [Clostridiales bacterium]|nr:hypothetical protein [Clostridiales bacterium]MBR6483941.1 hypothetical protein [Clostridiales bacterium]
MDYNNEEMVNKKLVRYQKLEFVMQSVTALAMVAIAVTVLILAGFIMKKVNSIYDASMQSLSKIDAISQEISDAKLGETVTHINDLTEQATGDLATTMEKIDSIDIEGLNEEIGRLHDSITSLNEAVDTMAHPFGG